MLKSLFLEKDHVVKVDFNKNLDKSDKSGKGLLFAYLLRGLYRRGVF